MLAVVQLCFTCTLPSALAMAFTIAGRAYPLLVKGPMFDHVAMLVSVPDILENCL